MHYGARIITNVRLVLPDRVVPGSVLTDGGTIRAVAESGDLSAAFPLEWHCLDNPELIDGEGLYLSPGFIDIHNHGRIGCDAMDGTAKSMEAIARHHAEHGVTGFLATTSSIPWEQNLAALRFLADYYNQYNKPETAGERAAAGAHFLGIYSEGNFYSMEKRGAHNPDYLKSALTMEDLDALLLAAGTALKVVSLSPELPGARECIPILAHRGIVAAAAHTVAHYQEALAGINAGITLATHTFNGMKSLSHQEPGILGAVLDDDRVCCELIADGIHVAPVILSLVYKLKGPGGIVLISDSMPATGLPDGHYHFAYRAEVVRDGAIWLENGLLAGSTLSLDRAVLNMVRLGGISLCHAVRAASLNPASVLGLDRRKGSIAPGKDADLILFDESINIKKVFM